MIRREPYRKRKSYTLSIFIVFLAIILSLSFFQNLFGVRSFLQAAIYPFQFIAVSTYKGVVGFPAKVADLRNLSSENLRLTKEVTNLKIATRLLEDLKKENKRLRQNLKFSQENAYQYRLLSAQVLGKSASPWFTFLLINRGAKAGVSLNATVVVAQGLVGRVVEVSFFSSKIMLITDLESSVASVDSRSRDYGIVNGQERENLQMKYVSAGKDIRPGDKITTSPISTLFPSGIMIGTILHAAKREHDLFYNIEIKPSVDFSKLEEVFVIL